MDNTLAYWRFVEEQVKHKIPVMLLYVVESMGSSPGRQGFCMAVTIAGSMKGSVGGGIMEFKFVELAKEILGSKQSYTALHKQVHNKDAATNQSGMICSGEQTILLYIIQPQDAVQVRHIIDCLEKHLTGCLRFSMAGMAFDDQLPPTRYSFSFSAADEWLYQEQTGYKDHLFIIGAGHCGLALSKLMQSMDFYIHLYDEREDLNTLAENHFVHETKILVSYADTGRYIKEGANSYVVAMTSGYRTDDMVVRALLNKQFNYFGVLGSSKKIEKMFTDYALEGVDPVILKRIHAPVGLSIKSRTPEEIAISIAAQVIAVKNGA